MTVLSSERVEEMWSALALPFPFAFAASLTVRGECHVGSVFSPAIRKQSRLLPKRHDPPLPVLDRLIKRSPRNPVVPGKSDKLLDMRVCVVTKLGNREDRTAAP